MGKSLHRTGIQFCIGILLIFCGLTAFCQDVDAATVKGRIFDSKSQPVPGAIIRVKDSPLTAISSLDGSYQILNVPEGSFEFQLSCMGYEAHSKIVLVNSGDAVLQLDFSLAESTTELDGVIVEGQSVKSEIETKGFAVEVVETEKAALQSVQTNDLLNRTAGVRVRQNGGLGSRVDYNLNGMTGGSVRIFIDGLPISTYGPSFSLNSIPPALIDRIEIYKGVIPAHLADDALGGAINVILKKGVANNLSASVSYGSFNTFQNNLNAVYRDENSGFTAKISAFHNYSDNDYEVWGKFVRNILPNGRYDYVRAKRFNDSYRSVGGKIDLGFSNVSWADQFFVSYTGSDDYNEIQHGAYMSIPYKGRFTTSQSNVFGLNYSKEDLLTKGLDLNFNGSFSKRSEVVTDTVKWNYNWFGERSLGKYGEPILRPEGAQQGVPTINHIDRNISTFRASANYDVNEHHKLILSQSYFNIDRYEQDMMRSAVEREFIGTRDLQKYITSLGYEFNLMQSRLKGNLFGKYYVQGINKMDPALEDGVRVEDRVSSKRNTKGYGMAYSFRLTKKLLILTSAEKAVRMPSEGEIFGSPSENIVENLSIRPEISNNFNLGFKLGSFERNEHEFSFSGTGFIRDTRDKITREINDRINDAVQTAPFVNLGKTKAIGFEGQVNYSYKKALLATLNFSKFNSVYNTKYDANGNVFDHYNQQIPNDPFFTVNSSLEYTVRDIFQSGSALRLSHYFSFVERFYTTWLEIEDFRTPRQYVHDFGATYILPNQRLSISADCRNIFDKQVYDNFAVQKPGRAFYLKINYSINNF
ncbi:TonB-dependent receptor [Echinicola marina]|uniref:TonB-dependent receptor n=1 Tax=Echinicola marina TaxID=2859768 RepID=UPI001CF6E56F|nr:TonB-dependent receptor [Echinicola marina]UCS95274.1 TonB-dependent receptor [Echinicola marina]